MSALEGEWDAAFAAVPDRMRRQLDALPEPRGGAAVCVYHRGRVVVDAWCGEARRGQPWEHDTMCMAWSTTKGIVSSAFHRLVDRGLIDYDDRVARHWPEFGASGKADITVRQVLCHESGLYDMESILQGSGYHLLDWEYVTSRLARQAPAFEPGSANAYCALTFGYLVGELMRRVTGEPVNDVIRAEIVEPLDLDGCFVGLPASEYARVAQLIASDDVARLSAAGGGREALQALAAMFGIEMDPVAQRAALGGPIPAMESFFMDSVAMSEPIPAANGVFTARAVARTYASLATRDGVDGVRLVSAATLERATAVQNQRPDRILGFPMMWRLGYHGVLTTGGVPPRGFGHNGLGGSGGWADPDHELAIAFVPSRLGSLIATDARFLELSGLALAAAERVAS